MIKHDTLYNLDSSDRIRIWYMERDGNKYRTISGLEDGQLVTSEWKVARGKNVGRSNETSPEEQAELEVLSVYTKKLGNKYYENRAEVGKHKHFAPMLAQTYRGGALSFPVCSQPKLDGIRCIARKDGLWSRQGKPIVSCDHIHNELSYFFDKFPDLVLDGELYNHQLKDDFNEIASNVRKTVNTVDTEGVIQFYVYDCSIERGFAGRLEFIMDQVQETNNVEILDTRVAEKQEELDKDYAEFMESGFEGQMIRLLETEFYEEGKRSNQLLKRKEFVDEEFEFVRFEEGQGNWAGYAKRVTCLLPDGREFGAGIRGTQEFTKKLLDLTFGQVTIRYQNLTPDGIPRFPVAVDFHTGARED